MRIPPNVSPPYYAVIFSSKKRKNDQEFSLISDELDELVLGHYGYLGHETVGDDPSITISYWRDLESIKKWREVPRHAEAMRKGKENWFANYHTQVALVEKSYYWEDK